MFGRFGSRVTVLELLPHILPTEAEELTDALADYLRREGIEVITGAAVSRVRREGGRVAVQATVAGSQRIFQASHLLAATGRTPNTAGMGLEHLGIERDARGFLKVDEILQSSVAGVYGAGDVIGEPMLVYTAAYEGALAAENALTDASRARDYTTLPWVVFTAPQAAGVGPAEAPVARLKNEFRYQVLIKAASRKVLRETLRRLREHALAEKWPPTALVIDVDPLSLM